MCVVAVSRLAGRGDVNLSRGHGILLQRDVRALIGVLAVIQQEGHVISYELSVIACGGPDVVQARFEVGVPIHEDEPSSIIAFVLAHEQYQRFLDDAPPTPSDGSGSGLLVHSGSGGLVHSDSTGTLNAFFAARKTPSTASGSDDTISIGVPARSVRGGGTVKGKEMRGRDGEAMRGRSGDSWLSQPKDSDGGGARTGADSKHPPPTLPVASSSPHFKIQWSNGGTKFYCQVRHIHTLANTP